MTQDINRPTADTRAPEPEPKATLGDVLHARGLHPAGMVAIRNTLHPDDASSDFRNIDDVLRANVLAMYDRMQDGPRIGDDTPVLSFVGLAGGQAKLTGFRRFMVRRPGVVSGDMVYDYDAAHLLHSFIARAETPTFYDVSDEPGLDDLVGRLVVQWPEPLARNIRAASDPDLAIVNF